MRSLVLITSVVLIVACSGSDEQSRAPDPLDIIVSKPFLNSLSSTSAVDIVISYGQSNALGRGFYDADNILVITPTANVKAQICPVDGEINYNSSCFVFNSLASPSDIYL